MTTGRPGCCYALVLPVDLDATTRRELVAWYCRRYHAVLTTTSIREGLMIRPRTHRAYGRLDSLVESVGMLLGLTSEFVAETITRCDRPERAHSHVTADEVHEIVDELLAVCASRPAEQVIIDEHRAWAADRGAL